MAEIEDDNIKKNASDLKDNTYGKKIADKASGYRNGAIVGGVAGFVAGYYFKMNIPICVLFGIVGGGYIGYTIAESSELKQEFNFKK